jgi:hypothetical protein
MTAADLDKRLTVTVSRAGFTGSITSIPTEKVIAADKPKPTVNSVKIEFFATAAGAASVTYTKNSAVRDEDHNHVLDGNGKYTRADGETGACSWDETKKQVTLKPEKAAIIKQDGEYGPLETKSEFKSIPSRAAQTPAGANDPLLAFPACFRYRKTV